jgi:transposase InsO family protein
MVPAEGGGRVLLEISVVEQRYQAVMDVLAGSDIVEVAARYGVSRHSVHRWVKRYEERGLNGLADRSHRPNSCPHQMSAELEATIMELRRVHPSWGPKRLAHELQRSGIDPPGLTSIYRALVRNHAIEPRPRRRRKADFLRWERPQPMQLWQMDVMSLAVGGAKASLITAIDDHSRFCITATVVGRATSRVVCNAFVAAMERFGIPDEVLTDNGKQFTGRYGPRPTEVLFDRLCRQNGIRHILTGVRSPTTTGKIERFHRTLREELLARRRFETIEQTQEAIDAYLETYNADRPHQALEMATPRRRFEAVPELSTLTTGTPSVGPMEVRRHVWSNGMICVAKHSFSIGRHLAGQIVTVRVNQRCFEVLWDGELVKVVARKNTKEVKERAVRPSVINRKTG